MSDCCKRWIDDLNTANTEIERLRGLWLAEQKARLEQTELVETYGAVKAKAEVKRLLDEVMELESDARADTTRLDDQAMCIARQVAEIERLRGAEAELFDKCGELQKLVWKYEAARAAGGGK